jgi:hypothetical protein
MEQTTSLTGNRASHSVFMVTDQAAAYLDVRPATLANWRSMGQGPAYAKLGRCIKYRRSDLDAFIAKSIRQAEPA